MAFRTTDSSPAPASPTLPGNVANSLPTDFISSLTLFFPNPRTRGISSDALMSLGIFSGDSLATGKPLFQKTPKHFTLTECLLCAFHGLLIEPSGQHHGGCYYLYLTDDDSEVQTEVSLSQDSRAGKEQTRDSEKSVGLQRLISWDFRHLGGIPECEQSFLTSSLHCIGEVAHQSRRSPCPRAKRGGCKAVSRRYILLMPELCERLPRVGGIAHLSRVLFTEPTISNQPSTAAPVPQKGKLVSTKEGTAAFSKPHAECPRSPNTTLPLKPCMDKSHSPG